MKKFIVLTSITDELVAIRISDIIYVTEKKGERAKITIRTEGGTEYYINSRLHSVISIIKEIEDNK